MDSQTDILNASPGKVAELLGMGGVPARVWRPQEIAAVFKHQMSAPVAVDLDTLPSKLQEQLRFLSDAGGLLLKSFRDLFQHPSPPVELLVLVKDFAKMNLNQSASLLPNEVAAAVYYLSIAAALVRLNRRISALKDDELSTGFRLVLAQDWLDEPSRQLLDHAADKLLTGRRD